MYNASGQLSRNEQVERYAPLVRRIAHHLMLRLPANVMVDDLIQNGMMGLLEALDRYVEEPGTQFESYAGQRIRGAMLDGLREHDWLPRQVRKEMKRVEQAIHQLEQKGGRQPSEGELAKALQMSLPDYQRLLSEARGYQIVHLEDIASLGDDGFLDRHLDVSSDSDPLSLLESANTRKMLVGAIDCLPEREKLVMALYYEQELNMREIGAVLEVTESRVCQLHNQAIARLRTALFQ